MDGWTCVIPCLQTYRGGQIASGTVACDGDTGGIDLEVCCLLGNVFGRSVGIVDCRREGRVGCGAIVHGYHRHAGLRTDASTQGIVGFDVTEHPAATVEIHHARLPPTADGAIESNSRSVGYLNVPRACWLRAGAENIGETSEDLPSFGCGHVLILWRILCGDFGEEGSGLGIEIHDGVVAVRFFGASHH